MESSMMKALMPFWIYWGLLATGCILFFAIPIMSLLLFPVISWICDSVTWNHFHLTSLIRNFNDRPLWLVFAVHFFAFWIGAEIGHAALEDKSEHNKPEEEQQ
jgi:hypothetical protein